VTPKFRNKIKFSSPPFAIFFIGAETRDLSTRLEDKTVSLLRNFGIFLIAILEGLSRGHVATVCLAFGIRSV
jgi:hypothetical protein